MKAMNASTYARIEKLIDENDDMDWDSYAYPCGLMARSYFNGMNPISMMIICLLFYKIHLHLRTRRLLFMKTKLLGKQT
jgi:hypothetical protein